MDIIYAILDNNHPCLSIYFDIEKAFDSVPRRLLLTKLINFDFDFNNLFTSYLDDRRQCVKLENSLSNVIDVTSGVRQGSVLGPLFFLLFIDDLPFEVVHSVYFLFCDDLKLHSSSSPEKSQRDFDTLSDWVKLNGHSCHPSKTKFLSFGSTIDNTLLQ